MPRREPSIEWKNAAVAAAAAAAAVVAVCKQRLQQLPEEAPLPETHE